MAAPDRPIRLTDREAAILRFLAKQPAGVPQPVGQIARATPRGRPAPTLARLQRLGLVHLRYGILRPTSIREAWITGDGALALIAHTGTRNV